MMRYTCKYAPIELFAGFGQPCLPLDDAPDDFELAESIMHPNICGFGKTIIQAVLTGKADQVMLVNCCDTMRRTFEVIRATGKCLFAYLVDMPHCANSCAIDELAVSLRRLRDAYASFCGTTFDRRACMHAFKAPEKQVGCYVGIMGVRASAQLQQAIATTLPLPVQNLTCLGLRDVYPSFYDPSSLSDEAFFHAYAAALLSQTPCGRMADVGARRSLYEDPNLRGIIYHTIRFCDFYGSEYTDLNKHTKIPMLRLESDFTRQGEEQLRTRIEAFAEGFYAREKEEATVPLPENALVAGIDSGSASTDVAIMNAARTIVASAIIPTQGSATASAEKSLSEALSRAGIPRKAIVRVVTTGYGRDSIGDSDSSITEITCHAKGASFLNPSVRTIIDIGGQDSKAISVDETGAVRNFAMNDKCAAGTGRFLEMMARTLGISLEDMSTLALACKHDVAVSSTCTVFAESEVVSLVARDTALPDIVAALDRSVAARTASLVKRVGVEDVIMMTGGVAKNTGVVQAIEQKLGHNLIVDDRAQIAGAIGAALFALE